MAKYFHVAKKRKKRKHIDPTFGLRLRALREAAELTQVQLGERADMHAHAIARLEAGRREPGWQTVLKLAEALACTPNDFRDI
jgi:transcriptional regulator with XRE-family HTH domain